MSRSYRKNPYATDGQNSRTGRRKSARNQANRRIRSGLVPEGKGNDNASYKRYNQQWDITDWKFYCPNDPKTRRK